MNGLGKKQLNPKYLNNSLHKMQVQTLFWQYPLLCPPAQQDCLQPRGMQTPSPNFALSFSTT